MDTIQEFGPAWYGGREMVAAVYYNVYAAMPSLHFGWTILFGILYLGMKPLWLKAFGVLYPVMTFFAITLTGNHYILDGVGGAAVIVASFALYGGIIWLKPNAVTALVFAKSQLGRSAAYLQETIIHWKLHATAAAAKPYLRPERPHVRKWKTGFPNL